MGNYLGPFCGSSESFTFRGTVVSIRALMARREFGGILCITIIRNPPNPTLIIKGPAENPVYAALIEPFKDPCT